MYRRTVVVSCAINNYLFQVKVLKSPTTSKKLNSENGPLFPNQCEQHSNNLCTSKSNSGTHEVYSKNNTAVNSIVCIEDNIGIVRNVDSTVTVKLGILIYLPYCQGPHKLLSHCVYSLMYKHINYKFQI